ncbi:hypothetical protein F511_11209 [Dorcoceras hygrometricum]|uniref:Uncharacterized protein n=1 Tax=Dorcoceras hygrometricum TaxID=472368 RepID=A0A2Z7CXI8_9LAMI|nr:hypothetical protein F511_11209 [Dorcoceras hygrometricum]
MSSPDSNLVRRVAESIDRSSPTEASHRESEIPSSTHHRARLLRIDQDEARLAAQGCTWYEIKASTLRESDISSIKEKAGISELYEVLDMSWRHDAHTLPPPTPEQKPDLTQFLDIVSGKCFDAQKLIEEDLLCHFRFTGKNVQLVGDLGDRMTKAEMMKALKERKANPEKALALAPRARRREKPLQREGRGVRSASMKRGPRFCSGVHPRGANQRASRYGASSSRATVNRSPLCTSGYFYHLLHGQALGLRLLGLHPSPGGIATRGGASAKLGLSAELVGLMYSRRRATRGGASAALGSGSELVGLMCSGGIATRGGASAKLGLSAELVGLMYSRRRATRGGASAALGSGAELVGLMCSGGIATRGGASAKLGLSAELVGLMYSRRRATRGGASAALGSGSELVGLMCSGGIATRGGASAKLGLSAELVGLMYSRRRATRGGASAELGLGAELVGLMCSGGIATRGGASAKLGLSAELVGLMYSRRRATRGGASAALGSGSELVGLMCSGGIATRGGASAKLGLSAELVGLMYSRRRATRGVLPVRNWA